jgi:translation initiation factor 1 (eIF-1/SUI1)
MKTLVNEINGRKDFPIFEGTNEKILEWVEMNLDMFGLNEEHSCTASLFEDEIEISGDEDLKIFKIVKVETIKL